MPTNSPGTDAKAGPLRYTKNHVYNAADSLGKGATATVYLGRHRQTGEQVAIKVFSEARESRHILQARSREIDTLSSLSHKNVMRILACEEEESSRNVVIIMPYCQEGSVQNLLDQPQNGFGFKETEFLRFLDDTTNGLEYLRQKGIIHRDIKPGNILKRIEEDGSSMYLLTDFGAARQLDEDETFMSIYGTEEYIHPNMFERAVLRQQGQSHFTASVDLWSVGVTVYQVSTGRLPFQALGGRQDSQMLFKIISERESGDISGIQRQSDGVIERSKRMPNTCYLSSGLRSLLEPMLAGIFEINPNAVWSFERYFQTVRSIVSMKSLDVFLPQSGTNMKVYLQKTDCYRDIQQKIAALTDVPPERQLILLSHTELKDVVEPNEQIQIYPKSIQNSQLFLFERENYDAGKLVLPTLPPFPAFSVNSSLSNDCNVSRQCASLSCFADWQTKNIHRSQNLLLDAKLNLRLYVQSSLRPLEKILPELRKILDISKKRVDTIRVSQNIIKNFQNLLDIITHSDAANSLAKITSVFVKEDAVIDEYITKISTRTEELDLYLSVLSRRLNELATPNSSDYLGCHDDDHCLSKIDHVRVGVQTVMSTFAKHKKYRDLHPHEQFIHNVERRKMENFLVKIDSFHHKCVENLKTSYTSNLKRISVILKHLTRRGKVETNLNCVIESHAKLNEKLDRVDEIYRRVSDSMSSVVKELLKTPGLIQVTEKLESEKSRKQSVPSEDKVSEKSSLMQQLLNQVSELQSSKTELSSLLDSNTQSLKVLGEILSSTDEMSLPDDQSSVGFTEESDTGAFGYS